MGIREFGKSRDSCQVDLEVLLMATVETTSETEQIGATAGMVWQLLKNNGPTKMADVVKQASASRDLVMQAIGWLAREDKIIITLQARSRVVELTD